MEKMIDSICEMAVTLETATAVLEKRGGSWKIVHFHTSAPRRNPQAAQPAQKS